jgi:putative solute:sodium symporter small subunit
MIMNNPLSTAQLRARVRRLTTFLLCIWLLTIALPAFYARELSEMLPGWPLHYWISAQGALLVFLALVVIHALLVNRWEACAQPDAQTQDSSLD